jgi:hypothetical protein
MRDEKIISELKRKFLKNHIGGLIGDFVDLAIGLLLVLGGIINLTDMQSIYDGIPIPDKSNPPEVFWISVIFIILGCGAIGRFNTSIKVKKVIRNLQRFND